MRTHNDVLRINWPRSDDQGARPRYSYIQKATTYLFVLVNKVTVGVLVTLSALLAVPFAISYATGSASQVPTPSGQLFQFQDMIGNECTPAAGYTQPPQCGGNPSPAVAGINPAGAPWVVNQQAQVQLNGNGQLQVNIQGLVHASGANTGLSGGANVVATLACQVTATTWSYTTTGFVQLDPNGNAQINQVVTLPSSPCYGAIVLVRSYSTTTGLAGNWFAVTGY